MESGSSSPFRSNKYKLASLVPIATFCWFYMIVPIISTVFGRMDTSWNQRTKWFNVMNSVDGVDVTDYNFLAKMPQSLVLDEMWTAKRLALGITLGEDNIKLSGRMHCRLVCKPGTRRSQKNVYKWKIVDVPVRALAMDPGLVVPTVFFQSVHQRDDDKVGTHKAKKLSWGNRHFHFILQTTDWLGKWTNLYVSGQKWVFSRGKNRKIPCVTD